MCSALGSTRPSFADLPLWFVRLLFSWVYVLVNFVLVLASRIICSSAGYWFKAGLVDLVVFPSCLLVKSSIPSPLVLESCSSHNMCGVSRFLSLHLYLRWVYLCCFKRFFATWCVSLLERFWFEQGTSLQVQGYWFSSCGFSQVMSGFVKDGFSS